MFTMRGWPFGLLMNPVFGNVFSQLFKEFNPIFGYIYAKVYQTFIKLLR